jgi:hypothetical protein
MITRVRKPCINCQDLDMQLADRQRDIKKYGSDGSELRQPTSIDRKGHCSQNSILWSLLGEVTPPLPRYNPTAADPRGNTLGVRPRGCVSDQTIEGQMT